MAEAFLAGDRYFDVRDTADLMGKGKKYLGKQHPFSGITPMDRRRIDELIAIRNFIVHNSRFAEAKYVEQVLKPSGIRRLLPPGRFLLTVVGHATRLDSYFVAVRNAAITVRRAL
jgi:hypothetical protein